ncbi:hypothetical protein NW762_007276 [Fusarium torreyae]|uniref:Peptidase M13 C-terminal domain-containing protein n=1 Tax=Fusarium torreyae TaxID=1237075 RepID=A0A9W8RZH1_9HYPO|nr:hypothetical protein NW762_007276 [Fusarium torreyae]
MLCGDYVVLQSDACGNWAIHNPNPAGQDLISGSTVTREPTELAAKRILEGPYPSCEDTGYITEEGPDGLSEVVETVIDMFPANEAKVSSTALTKTLTWFESVSIESLQRLLVWRNSTNSDYVEVRLRAPDFKNDVNHATEEDEAKLINIMYQLLTAVYPHKINSTAVTVSVNPFESKLHDLTNAYNDLQTRVFGQDPKSLGPHLKRFVDLVSLGVDWVEKSASANYVPPHGLTWILAPFFVDEQLSPENSKLASNMADYLRGSFDTIAIEKNYSDIEIQSSPVHNSLTLAKSTISRQWKSLGKPFSGGQSPNSALQVNAFHLGGLNQIHLMPGYMEAPHFDMEHPSYINYGAAGCTIGHEITHGFDSEGYKADKTGKLTTWWNEKSMRAFENKTKCFIEQYSNTIVKSPNGSGTDIHIDGRLTLAENIANARGVVAGFAA